jgi:hypothetical protein
MFPTKTNKVLNEQDLEIIKRYEDRRRIANLSIDNIVDKLPAGRGIIYTRHIRDMRKYAERIKKKHSNLNVQMIWSLNNKKDEMTSDQYEIWESVLNDEIVPSDIDILFINASCETCVNIRSEIKGDNTNYKIDYMVINSDDEEVAVQVRGRYRDDLDVCYYDANMKKGKLTADYEYEKYVYVPTHFLNKPLFKDDKEQLCKLINYRRNGTLMMFPTIKKMLLETGDYEIVGGDKNHRKQKGGKDREYYIINLVM